MNKKFYSTPTIEAIPVIMSACIMQTSITQGTGQDAKGDGDGGPNLPGSGTAPRRRVF